MNQQSIGQLHSEVFSREFKRNSLFSSYNLANENANSLRDVELPSNVKIPSGEDIRVMKRWEMEYKTKNPKASDREVRRAVQKYFNIVVIDNQAMIPNK